MPPALQTLLAALAVGMLFYRLRVPGGMMVGAVVGACALNLATGSAAMPWQAKTAAQIAAGAFIGVGVRREDLREMSSIVKTAGIVIGCLMVVNIVSGLIIWGVSPLDPLTALMASAPGGLSDIPIIAADMGADASKVLVLQFVRFVMGIAVFPTLISLLPMEEGGGAAGTYERGKADWPHTLLTLIAAAVAGLLGRASPVPGGTMAFATIGSIAFKLVYEKACLKKSVRLAAQCLSGAYVGAGIGMTQIMELRYLFAPALALLLCYTLGALLIGRLLQKQGIFTRRESYLAATPAGASDMALISADLGVRNVRLILLQVMRLIVVITIFPTVLRVLAGWIK